MTVILLDPTEKDLASLLERARAGEEIVISDGKEPRVRLTLAYGTGTSRPSRRGFGILKGQFHVPDEALFGPLPDDELKRWNGESDDP